MAAATLNNRNLAKQLAAQEAVKLVKNNDIVGLGTGSTARFALMALAERLKEGLQIRGVPSSLATEAQAKALGIPLLPLGEVAQIDISIDGADEFNEELQLIKGGGGALFREKIVASLSKNRVVVVDSSKKVAQLGAFKVPVELVPVACRYVLDQFEALGGQAQLRYKNDALFITDNQNYIADVDFGLIANPEELAIQLNQIEGVLAHGLFIGLATKVIMATGEGLLVFEQSQKGS
ncbi:ribose-5-phosphate isomerase RpiA [Pedobacter sp. KR3-3]|uniref:Ribose-5-phosphate isomerase A n=1 Tax=Pedobacter albus TaxID=3113905 RepID=A0ABU7I6C2_9SPHI|nr:ribose-5-phosphate isomerase RpiA [Pedobacter sp. KR3-3]MEE1945017.1 ribose-5-phosphate isomerase RpiA [Pedobacter sp. KR3-3]